MIRIAGVLYQPIETLSKGFKRRVGVAQALLHDPEVLILDEPTIGLDPQTRASIWSYIRELRNREHITIFMTTHYMDEAEYCDRIAIIDQGKIIALDTPQALKASIGKDRVQMHTEDDARALHALAEQFGITATMAEGAVTFAVEEGEQFIPKLFSDFPVAIRSVNVSRPSLDDVFMSYTGTTIRDAEASTADQLRAGATLFRRGGR